MQYANTDETRPLSDEEVADVKRITKRFHYYANAVDATMLHALGDINCKVSEGIATAGTLEALKLFLSCASWSAGAPTLLRASGMALRTGSNGARLVFPRSRSPRVIIVWGVPCYLAMAQAKWRYDCAE